MATATLLVASGEASAVSGRDNGVASKSANKIVSSSRSAVSTITAVHVSGYLLSGGKTTLDLHLITGKGGEGTISSDGLKFSLIVIGQTAYLRGGKAFWPVFGGGNAARLLAGKWVSTPASGKFAAFARLTAVCSLFSKLLRNSGRLAKGGRTIVNGQRVIAVTDTMKGGTLYVATTGKPYPILLTKPGKAGSRIAFDRFNQAVGLAAPRKAIALSRIRTRG